MVLASYLIYRHLQSTVSKSRKLLVSLTSLVFQSTLQANYYFTVFFYLKAILNCILCRTRRWRRPSEDLLGSVFKFKHVFIQPSDRNICLLTSRWDKISAEEGGCDRGGGGGGRGGGDKQYFTVFHVSFFRQQTHRDRIVKQVLCKRAWFWKQNQVRACGVF